MEIEDLRSRIKNIESYLELGEGLNRQINDLEIREVIKTAVGGLDSVLTDYREQLSEEEDDLRGGEKNQADLRRARLEFGRKYGEAYGGEREAIEHFDSGVRNFKNPGLEAIKYFAKSVMFKTGSYAVSPFSREAQQVLSDTSDKYLEIVEYLLLIRKTEKENAKLRRDLAILKSKNESSGKERLAKVLRKHYGGHISDDFVFQIMDRPEIFYFGILESVRNIIEPKKDE